MVTISKLSGSIKIDKDGVVFIVPPGQFRTDRRESRNGDIMFYVGFSPYHTFSEKIENVTVDNIQLTEENYVEQLGALFFFNRVSVFGYRYLHDAPDDRVEVVNDLPYDLTGVAPVGSKRWMLLNKIRPYQCDHDGSSIEYLRDDVQFKLDGTPLETIRSTSTRETPPPATGGSGSAFPA